MDPKNRSLPHKHHLKRAKTAFTASGSRVTLAIFNHFSVHRDQKFCTKTTIAGPKNGCSQNLKYLRGVK
jgi:hypothetical protein